jgi:hypothetical protein
MVSITKFFHENYFFVIYLPPHTFTMHIIFFLQSGQGQRDSLGGSYSVLYDAIADEGSLGLLSFGLLTACQVVPGFLCFATTRTLLWLLCGPTRQRQRQHKRRKEVRDN